MYFSVYNAPKGRFLNSTSQHRLRPKTIRPLGLPDKEITNTINHLNAQSVKYKTKKNH